MSRLLFAAARGARLESEYHNWSNGGNDWREADLNRLVGSRIHPDDAHLQYGPISTAVREVETRELMSSQFPGVAVHAALACGLDSEWVVTWRTQGVGDRAIALLILAEALADEGL